MNHVTRDPMDPCSLDVRRVSALLLTLGLTLVSCSKSPARTRAQPVPLPPSVSATPAQAEELVTRTNAHRVALGLPPLARQAALMRAAQLQADQMAALNTMAHDLPHAAYPTLDARLAAVEYRMAASGENVAEGYPSAAAVVAGWMTSPGHRANIVATHFTQMGAGVATASNGHRFYAQVFGSPR